MLNQKSICIVHPSKNKYSETFIQDHIRRLPAKVRVLYGGDYTGAPPLYKDDDQPLILKASPISRILRSFKRKGIESPHNYSQIAAITRFLKNNKIEAVLAEFGPTGVAVMGACVQASVPLIVHFHGYDAYREKMLAQVWPRYPELFRKSSAVIAVSRDMQQQLICLGCPVEKVHYNPCGTDVSIFKGSDPKHAPPLFVAVGRFTNKKAPHLTILAFKEVLKSIPQARLVMVGDGPLWDACHQMLRALSIENSVELIGACSHKQVLAMMQRARGFVQHSVQASNGDAEGTPVAILEAGATGLPVVATRHTGIKDVVLERETGFLVDERDIKNMAHYMTLLGQEPALAAQLGQAARQRVCAKFSMEKSINNLWAVIKETINLNSR